MNQKQGVLSQDVTLKRTRLHFLFFGPDQANQKTSANTPLI